MEKIRFIFLLFAAFAAVSCDPVSMDAPEFEVKEKTVLIYMVANNNLSGNSNSNFEDLKTGHIPEDGNLLVYKHDTGNKPVLMHLKKGAKGEVVQDTVYRFPLRNSATPEVLESVLKVTGTMFPAKETGLFLWSHGTGWLPEGYYTKSFGSEDGVEMEITELADALPYKLSFVVFDACLMGCVEVAYQLKDSVDYVISSPAEILSSGFPYSRIMQHIFKSEMDLQAVAKEYYDFYNAQSGSSRSATISLVRTSALKGVADAAAVVFEKYRDGIGSVDASSVQRYYRSNKRWFYDLGDFITRLAGEEDAAPVMKALDEAVIYKAATPNFLEIPVNPERYSGLGTYIPVTPVDSTLNAFYMELDWNRDVQMIKGEEE